jgi:hypothetical protein
MDEAAMATSTVPAVMLKFMTDPAGGCVTVKKGSFG